jgi:signal transduction histidine kinase
MTTQTLRSKINRLMSLSIGAIGIFAVTTILIFSHYKSIVHIRSVTDSLFKSTKSQIDLLIPTFLLPEQKEGTKLVLKKMEEEDNLEQAITLQSKLEVPNDYEACKGGTSCVSKDGKYIGVIAPIADSGQVFGYLFKSKKIETTFGTDLSLYLVAAVASVLIFTFMALFWGTSRITVRDVPDALRELVRWVETVLEDDVHSSTAPNLKFKELNDLGSKIAEVVERHDSVRDEAIIGQIASGVMHDIRTPLQPLLTAIELVDELEENDPKRAKRLENLLEVSRTKVHVINQIVETTLDGVRKINLKPENTSLNETLKKAILLSREITDLKTTTLDFIEESPSTVVSHDPTQMARVFSNLIKNGVEAQANADSGKVKVTITIKSGAPTVLIEDAGPGLTGDSERALRRCRSTKVRGSGLGLLTSWKIVEAHGGNITVGRSKELGGASLEVTLPTQGESV